MSTPVGNHFKNCSLQNPKLQFTNSLLFVIFQSLCPSIELSVTTAYYTNCHHTKRISLILSRGPDATSMSNTKSAAQVEKDLKTEANKAADSLNDAVKDASHRVDDFKKDAKHKLDDLTAAAAKEVDDFKKSLPEKEEEVKNFFQKIYHSVATTANNFYTSVRTTVEENPIATSQVFLAAVIGTAAYYGNETGKFRVDFNDKKSKELTGAIVAGIAALDTLFITLYNQKQSKKLI
ncbi:unnamed protein product [Ambrosiozyma monospora]|uniref:Unnamed protein product n=1 Tax=Ambrosiozyma monospora TaxID=43982 RepID=A0ACB5U270_AMBMO|nr:unnamed protein product [Ambrosiozyma monospora]